MKQLHLVLGAVVAIAAVSAPTQAQVTIAGTTTGCFYTTNDATCIGSSYGGLTFKGGAFSVDATPGDSYNLNTLSDYLGTFALSANANGNFGDPLRFRLTVSFSSPTSASPNPYITSADFDGDVVISGNGSDLDVDFSSSYGTINYDGGSDTYFLLRANDVSNISRGESKMLTCKIECEDDDDDICKLDGSHVNVPEPSSVLLMAPA